MVKGKIMDKFAKEGAPLKVVFDPTVERAQAKQETKPTEAKPTETQPVEKPIVKPAKENEKIEGEILVVMRVLAENGIVEVSSTLLRDKLGLKKGGRGAVRRAMRKMEAEGKIVIGSKANTGKRKQFTYRLKEETEKEVKQ